MNKKIGLISLFFMIALIFISNALAITGSIGNARMVLRAETGAEIEKYILVKNVNNVTVNIELSTSGDLEKYVEIKDGNFTLKPGEEKNAYFTIKAVKEGTTETKIDVKFMPLGGKNGVGLSSTIIFIATGEDKSSWFNWGNSNTDNTDKNGKTNYVVIALSVTGVIFFIFIVLLVMASKINKKRTSKLKKSAKRDE